MRAPILAGLGLMLLAPAARANLVISAKPTENVTCSGGVCTATAANAVLNVSDLAAMLGSGDVTVATGGAAKDIELKQPLSWTSTSRLTLDAQRSIILDKPVTVAGTGALTVATDDGGRGGEFLIEPKASVQFWDLESDLIIGGKNYKLIGDLESLAADIVTAPSGYYAIAKPYDASSDGTYQWSAIPTAFRGIFEGLGNPISNLKIGLGRTGGIVSAGLFAQVKKGGTIKDVRLQNVEVNGSACSMVDVGMLVGELDQARVEFSYANGAIMLDTGCGDAVGGLVGVSSGDIDKSSASTRIRMEGDIGGCGGLVGFSEGKVTQSFAVGSLIAKANYSTPIGGLVAANQGQISDSYSLVGLHEGKDCCDSENTFGGLVGENDGVISTSYAAGIMVVNHAGDKTADHGGLVGTDNSVSGSLISTYWDLDKGIGDPAQGAGNVPNDPGITGLSDSAFQSGVPVGFSPKIWGEGVSNSV